MSTLKKEVPKKVKNEIEMFEALSKAQLNFIRGGDQGNTEKGGDQ